ncbi:hypothetical protein CLIB1423_09S01068 [[Candida] railenensis]|uniref:Thioredoxin domain-containing protein n=1 Tax=[Candida] railenensis TaxID=45579 RepID=A0A9P0QPF2_9ASCO|nr:hypothetical protein CLIB1423_09S01068 [[Candida] railenensis]
MVKILESKEEIYYATQNESHTIIYFSSNIECPNPLNDKEYENLQLLYPEFYFYKVEVESFKNWQDYAMKNKIIALPMFSYYTNEYQFASYYAFSPLNKILLDTLVGFDEETDDDFSIDLESEVEDMSEGDCDGLLKDISKYINDTFVN